MAKPKDKEELLLNPTTGKLDLVKTFNVDSILFSEYIHTGSIRVTYDPGSASFVEENPVVIVDNNGNTVRV